MTTTGNTTHKVPFAAKFWYGAADIYGGGAFNIINFYYAFFLTSILRINPFWVALIIPVSKVWDAVTDPIMGRITDNTRTKFGRRRIYFLIGIPLIFVSFFILWRSPGYESQTARAIYALISYIIFCTVNTMIMVPYQAMMPELSDDYNERSSISGIRMSFSLGSSLICALIPLIIVNMYPAEQISKGYAMMGVFFGIFFALPFIGTFIFTKEREEFMNAPKIKGNIFSSFIDVLKIKTFRTHILMYLCSFLALDVITILFMYMMTYYMQASNMTNYVLGTLIFVQIISIPLTTKIAKKTSKARAYKYGCIAWAILSFSLILLTPSMGVIPVFVIAVLMGCAISFPVVMVYSIFSDISDVGELYFNKRIEGTFSGAQTFIRKTSSAIATGLVMAGLGLSGFIESDSGEIIQQSDTVLWTIRLIIAFVPGILLLIGAKVSKNMALTPKNHPILLEYLEKSRKGDIIEEKLSNEIHELKSIL